MAPKFNAAAAFGSISSDKSSSKGLSKLNAVSNSITPDRIVSIDISEIEANPLNATIYSISNLSPLAKDIAERGVRQPLIVKETENGKYMVISGHRRLAATSMAISDYGYASRFVPCIIKKPNENISEIEDIIRDNIQRDKSSYEKMLECVTVKKILDEQKASGNDAVSDVWAYMDEHYDFKQSEISRYTKIHKNLIPALMERFKLSLMSTDVAYRVAGESEEFQNEVAKYWDYDDTAILTVTAVNAIKSNLEKASAPKKSSAPRPVVCQDIPTGIKTAVDSFNSMNACYEKCSGKISKRTNKALLKKLNRLCLEIETLEAEIKSVSGEDA